MIVSVVFNPFFIPADRSWGSQSHGMSVLLSGSAKDEWEDLVLQIFTVAADRKLGKMGIMEAAIEGRGIMFEGNKFEVPREVLSLCEGRVRVDLRFNEPVSGKLFTLQGIECGNHFLHPVLGYNERDYPDGRLNVDIVNSGRVEGRGEWEIRFDVNVKSVLHLIERGSAVCAVKAVCEAAGYSKTFTASEGNNLCSVLVADREDVWRDRDVRLVPQIVLVEDAEVALSEAAEEYGGGSVLVEAGCLIAVGRVLDIRSDS